LKQSIFKGSVAAAIVMCAPLAAMAAGGYVVQGGKDIATQVCENKGAMSSCLEVAAATSNSDLVDITRVNFGLKSTATWIETRTNSYQLCAVDAIYERQCASVAMPRLFGTHLTTKTSGGKTHLVLNFNKNEKTANAVQRGVITDTLLRELQNSRNELDRALGRASGTVAVLSPNHVRHDLFPQTADLVSTMSVCTVQEEGRVGGPGGAVPMALGDCGGGGGDLGGGGTGGGDLGGGGGGSIGGGGGDAWNPDPGCMNECYANYDNETPYCNELPSPPLRAACFAGAMAVMAACIALC